MKKILIVSNMYPSPSNPEYGIFVKNFVDQVEKIGIPYEKVVMYKANNALSKLFNYLTFFSKAVFKILKEEYDSIYVHYPSISGIPVIFTSLFKKSTIYTNVHGTDVLPVSNLEKKLVKNTSILLDNSKKVIVPSDYYKNILINDFGVESSKIYIYPSGGIDSEIFYPKENLQKHSDNIKLGLVGRIIKTKGWKVLSDALELLSQEYSDKKIEVTVIGEGQDYDALKKQLDKLEGFLEVEFISFVSQEKLNDYYNSFDALIFPTYKESLGLVALEAMSSGTPVIASDIAPLNNYINHQINGLLFQKGSSLDLKNKIIAYINYTEQEKESMSREAFKSSQIYSKENSKKILEKIFC